MVRYQVLNYKYPGTQVLKYFCAFMYFGVGTQAAASARHSNRHHFAPDITARIDTSGRGCERGRHTGCHTDDLRFEPRCTGRARTSWGLTAWTYLHNYARFE